MIREFSMHRSNHGQFVGARREVRKQIADRNAAFSVLLEFERRGKRDTGSAFGLEILERQHLAGTPSQLGFRIEGIDL